jgi:hypothetical protein
VDKICKRIFDFQTEIVRVPVFKSEIVNAYRPVWVTVVNMHQA